MFVYWLNHLGMRLRLTAPHGGVRTHISKAVQNPALTSGQVTAQSIPVPCEVKFSNVYASYLDRARRPV